MLRFRVAAALAVALVGAGVGPAAAATTRPDVVRTEAGAVRGVVAARSIDFLGVPYAAPPTGERRWRPPAAPVPWTGVRAATAAGPWCAQSPDVFNGFTGSTAEDCLTVNVHVPRRATGRLPVMVWLHGGSFVTGSSDRYRPDPLLAAGDAVVVTVNYRLGALGFLAHPQLGGQMKTGSAGNYGLLDQQAALAWVRRNIARFGGDPGRVTLFGQSAGAVAVCAHLASPRAAGLFTRAIVQSGSCVTPTAPAADALAAGSAFAGQLGCDSAACLRAAPVTELLAAAAGTEWGPAVDGAVLPTSVPEAVAAGRVHRVPVMEGTTHDETRIFTALQFDAAGTPMSEETYRAVVGAQFGGAAAKVLAEYPSAAFGSPGLAYSALTTDAWFSCPAAQSRALLASRTTVYGYEFDDPQAPPVVPLPDSLPLGAYHAAELPYLFRLVGVDVRLSPAQQRLSRQMAHYWLAFARTGRPAAIGVAPWPAHGSGGPVQRLAPDRTAPSDAFTADHRCAFWASLA
ncbi:carboxylesterase/lipase family protein [Micromonospora sp. CPCC 206061]|uniref:carboxylesterase/lipase family protein n=1 Tax=Micromonospora sp. CPCC 206061 TaxID=3122410 RepID=UPI002FF3BC07